MAVSDAVQSLTAAFSFGILITAASGALLLYINGHGGTISQDGRRLVLALFLFFAAFWALADFVNLLVTSPIACQSILVFSSASDQLARVALEQFLLWSVGSAAKVTTERLIMQGILGIRLIAGGILVGFTRPDFAPVCVAQTSLFAVAVVVLALDALLIGVLIIRGLGKTRETQPGIASIQKDRSKALTSTAVGLLLWTGASVVMLLGKPSTLLILRTTLPAVGLILVVVLVAIFSGKLLAQEQELTTPEATSPFVGNGPQMRENLVGNGSPALNQAYNKAGNLFVVNPSTTPQDSRIGSQVSLFQSNYQGDPRGFSKLEGTNTTVRAMENDEQPQSRNLAGYRGSSGVFPTGYGPSSMGAIQGATLPQIHGTRPDLPRSVTAPPSVAQQGRGMFGWLAKSAAQPTVRSLGISGPVMSTAQDGSEQPFSKIPTIDLATAASNERQRREVAAAKSRLLTDRTVPYPPGVRSQEALRQSISVTRKQMPQLPTKVMPTIASSSAPGLSVGGTMGNSTSSSLSPGHEEVRRRSPRSVNTFGDPSAEQSVPRNFLPNPPRGPPPSQTRGLPSNPRATRILKASKPEEPTVMLINDIVYNDPAAVTRLENGVSANRVRGLPEKSVEPYTSNLKSSDSIIHRPRPYRRNSEHERSIYPSEPSPRHVRSKSGSSITTRKSALMPYPGSPTQLPDLPPLPMPPPTTAASLKRLLPNDTKSMTFDEKIELLFPAPPGITLQQHRRSSVPSLPRIPSAIMWNASASQSPIDDTRASKRMTLASFGLHDSHIPDSERRPDPAPKTGDTYRFSPNTYRTLADDVGSTWIPGIPTTPKLDNTQISTQHRSDLQIPPFEPRKSAITERSSTDVSESTTFWGSVHSEVPAIDLSKALRNANSIQITDIPKQTSSQAANPNPDEIDSIPIMLGTGESQRLHLALERKKRSLYLAANPIEAIVPEPTVSTWHRRIGDELPTFSGRKEKENNRKMPPPTPLLLNSKGRVATIIIRAPEPSPPYDDPERAIAEIQAQLQRFEEPGRGSVGSLLRHLPGPEGTENKTNESNDRLRLLENLEDEMGQQENQWQQMQRNLDRDSMSTSMSPSIDNSRPVSQLSSLAPSTAASRRVRARSNMSRSKSEEPLTTGVSMTSTEGSDNSRASIWQQRLAEAQMEYSANAPALLSRKQSVNFLSVARNHPGMGSLGSPTPPDSLGSGSEIETDSEMESESESEDLSTVRSPIHARRARACLWEPAPLSPKAAVGRMWSPPYESVSSSLPEAPAKSMRPAQRITLPILSLSSSRLWSKPAPSRQHRAVVGLWGSKLACPKPIQTRPITQKPQRKSKRVTFLPDIVESPLPLPHKRDTLGIYQFPWGEKSDSAIYQPAFNPVALGPVTSAALEARSRALELEEYSSSFFDDYDDEDMDIDDEESDDDFDETTLWEIANLLNTTDVPTTQFDEEDDTEYGEEEKVGEMFTLSSLPIQPLATRPIARVESQLWTGNSDISQTTTSRGLSHPDSDVWEEYTSSPSKVVRPRAMSTAALAKLSTKDLWAASEPKAIKSSGSMWSSTNIQDRPASDTIESHPTLELLTAAVFVAPKKMPKATKPLLWAQQSKRVSTQVTPLFSTANTSTSMRTTKASPVAQDIERVTRISTESALSVSSNSLWAHELIPSPREWILTSHTSTTKALPMDLLWTPPKANEVIATSGLFVQTTKRSLYHASTRQPVSINIVRTPRMTQAPLSPLTSNKLWSRRKSLEAERDWISESSVRPQSPSIYSESSSGQSSPSSDSASETFSLKSTSTQASSVWASLTSNTSSNWWSSKKSESGSPVESPRSAPKVPTRKQPSKPLESVRESRVLSSRDMWEAMAPPTLEAPKKLRKTPSKSSFPKAAPQDIIQATASAAPKKTLSRPVATVADWNTALATALAQGQPRLQRLTATPEMWQKSLQQAIIAGAGESKSAPFDSSVMHPVFFTQAMVSQAIDIHPAAIGYVSRPVTKTIASIGMWTTVPQPISSEAAPLLMWSASGNQPSIFAHIAQEPVRRAIRPRLSALSVLQSSQTWQPTRIAPPECNWISPEIRSYEQISIPSTATIVDVPYVSGNGTWVAPVIASSKKLMFTVAAASSLDLFAHIKGDGIRRKPARSLPLPRLNSYELFQPKLAVGRERNWLTSNDVSIGVKAVETSKSFTWNPSPVNAGKSITFTILPTSSPDMFAHLVSAPTKKTSAIHVAPLPSLESNVLFAPKSSNKPMTHWLKVTSATITTPTMISSSAKTWVVPSPELEHSLSYTVASTILFSNIATAPLTRTTRAYQALPVLTSDKLFSVAVASASPINWLHTSTILPPKTSFAVRTWTPPTPSAPVSKSYALAPTALFAHLPSAPRSRRPRADLATLETTSTRMWRRDYSIPVSPVHWLVRRNKMFTGVEFRY